MSIDIGQFFGGLQSSTYSSNALNGIFSSITYTTILLGIIVIIIVMAVYPCKKGTPMWVLAKLFFYVCLTTVIVLSFHNGIIKDKCEKKYRDEKINEFTGGYNMNNPIYNKDRVNITPTVDVSKYHTNNYNEGGADSDEESGEDEPVRINHEQTVNEMITNLQRKR